MFQGQAFTLRQVDRNRFEFRSAYTQRLGTFVEIQKIVKDHADTTHRQAVELAFIRQKLKEVGEAVVPLPVPVTVIPTARPKPVVVTPSAEPAVVTPVAMRAKKPMAKERMAAVIPIDDARVKREETAKKRRPSSMEYLRGLLAQGGRKKAR